MHRQTSLQTSDESRSIAVVLFLFASVCWMLGGCTSVTRSFGGRDANQVWTAMVVVAENPVYDDWKVDENEVWVDAANQRIEIYRRLRRVLYRPAVEPWPQERAYRFQVRLAETDPPRVKFMSRGWAVPSHARYEGERYFNDVSEILVGPSLEDVGVTPTGLPQMPEEPTPILIDDESIEPVSIPASVPATQPAPAQQPSTSEDTPSTDEPAVVDPDLLDAIDALEDNVPSPSPLPARPG